MVLASLLVAGASTLCLAATYAYVGAHLLRKGNAIDRGRAVQMLGGWWIATALNQLLGGLLNVAASFGWTDLALHVTYVYVQRLLLALSLIGLMYYLVYLQTGRGRLVLLTVVYGLWWASQIFAVTVGVPSDVGVYRWRTDLVYSVERPPALELLQLFIVLPPVVGSLALLRVYRRVGTRTQRFRIGVLAAGFTVWWIVAILAGNRATFDSDLIQATNRAIGVIVALAVLVAYETPAWMRRRLHLDPAPSAG